MIYTTQDLHLMEQAFLLLLYQLPLLDLLHRTHDACHLVRHLADRTICTLTELLSDLVELVHCTMLEIDKQLLPDLHRQYALLTLDGLALIRNLDSDASFIFLRRFAHFKLRLGLELRTEAGSLHDGA